MHRFAQTNSNDNLQPVKFSTMAAASTHRFYLRHNWYRIQQNEITNGCCWYCFKLLVTVYLNIFCFQLIYQYVTILKSWIASYPFHILFLYSIYNIIITNIMITLFTHFKWFYEKLIKLNYFSVLWRALVITLQTWFRFLYTLDVMNAPFSLWIFYSVLNITLIAVII